MKGIKVIIPVVLGVALAAAVLSSLGSGVKESKNYKEHLKSAQESVECGLYEQAIEQYKAALAYKKKDSIYQSIMKTYDLLYAENPSLYVRECYISDMEQAAADFPENADYWKAQINLNLESRSDAKAYEAAKRAMKVPVKDKEIADVYEKLLYQVKTDFQMYPDFKYCLNGYISAFDGNQWQVLDENGNVLSGNYMVIGRINNSGRGIYRDETATWLLDENGVARKRFALEISDAGYYSESMECVPVEIDGVWKYLKGDGSFLPGEFEQAGCFNNGQAAVKQDGVWYLIDGEGKKISKQTFEDIKLDLYGCHLQSEVILAKKDGKYHIYDTELKQVGEFACDDIDICIDGNLIAFKQGKAWGYVDTKGNVVIEPTYAGAKSFANGMAAVCDAEGHWGFINRNYKLVIDYRYLDAYYYTSQETCIVSQEENSYQIQCYQFE